VSANPARLWLRILVSVGVLVVLLVVLPWDELRAAVGRVSLFLWLSVLVGFAAGHLLGTAKWRLVVNAHTEGSPLGLREAIRCHVAGLFANLYLPTIVGGDVLRGVLAGRAIARPEAALLGGALDRLIDVCALGLLLAVGALGAGRMLPTELIGAVSSTLIAAIAITVLFVAVVAGLVRGRFPARWARPIARLQVALRRVGRRPGAAMIALGLSLVMQGAFVLMNAAIGEALGIGVPWAIWFLVWPLAKIAGMLPISLGGLGVRDATLAALLALFGVPLTLGLIAGLVWQSVVWAGGLAGGLAWWTLKREGAVTSDGTLSTKGVSVP
jgi:uncharacterized membrane protein YbhN (UPF0104 family)